MHWYDYVAYAISLSILSLTALLIVRRKLYHMLPVFTAYIAYVIVMSVFIMAVSSTYGSYTRVYWYTQIGEISLSIAAVYESFSHIFRSFFRLWWFRSLLPATIITAFGFSTLQAYRYSPASLSNVMVASAIIGTEYIIVSICVLFFVLALLIDVRWRLYEFRIVLGFGIAATTFGITVVLRYEFVTKYNSFCEALSTIGYYAAELLWLSAVLAKEPPAAQNLSPNPTKEMVGELREQVRVLRRFLGKH